MGHGHGHGHGHAPASASGRHVRPLAISCAVLAVFTVLEVTVGLITGSLALLSMTGLWQQHKQILLMRNPPKQGVLTI